SCFYGIGVKTGVGGDLVSLPKLYLTPSLNVFYTVQISVDRSGNAQYSVSAGGQVLGESGNYVGAGPFYIILMQSEGWPDSGTGPNVAYWQSVSLTASPSSPVVSVYPTEPAYATISVNYSSLSLTAPIHIAVAQDKNFPKGLTFTFRPVGAGSFTSTADIQPSPKGSSPVQVNATLNCVVGNCMQPGGTQLPQNYALSVVASSNGQTQNTKILVNLLKAKWLIMMYCALVPELHFDIRQNVLEMAAATKVNDNPAVGMLVLWYADSATSFPGTAIQPTGTIALYRVANGSVTQVGSAWSQTNFFDPATLHAFLTTAMGMVPADRNQLILTDHGAGILGFGKGTTTRYLSIPELATALSGISPKLDILSFDACLMSQVEVLYQLRSYASYFTASERTAQSGGYDYTGFLTPLLSSPDQATVAYLNTIVATYREKYTTRYYMSVVGEIPTLAAIDSSQLQGVVSGLNSLSTALVRDYGTKSQQFNQTMLQVLAKTVKSDGPDPYLDVRSLAQNILNSGITDQSVRTAAGAVVLAVKAAVIANTTTSMMYGGLTVLLFPKAQVFERGFQTYSSVDAQLSFPSAASWFPLMRSVNRSASSAFWTLITVNHPGHQLYLNVYTSTGGHTGYNPALLNISRTAIEVIPGSYYLDFGNGTVVIALPPSVQSFTTVVDGTAMEESTEAYTLTYTVVQNGTVTSTKTVDGSMTAGTLQSAQVMIQNGILEVGATTVMTSTTSATSSSAAPATSSATSVTSSASSAGSGSSIATTDALLGPIAVALVILAAAVLARRRRDKPLPEPTLIGRPLV
ncbi:MAG: clostripain-related cysteine peptidase, partial [Nitrososphaerales archaeon]